YVLPDSHTNALATANFALTIKTCVAAEPKAEMAMPIKATSIGWKLFFQAVTRMMPSANAAPTVAPSGMNSGGIAGKMTNSSIAPAPAMDVTPSTLASANGFRSTPCSMTPVIASITPTMKEVKTRGTRKFQTTGSIQANVQAEPLKLNANTVIPKIITTKIGTMNFKRIGFVVPPICRSPRFIDLAVRHAKYKSQGPPTNAVIAPTGTSCPGWINLPNTSAPIKKTLPQIKEWMKIWRCPRMPIIRTM